MLSEKYGPPQRESLMIRGEDTVNKSYCAGLKVPFDNAKWDLVDSRSDKYSIEMQQSDSTYYYFPSNEADACRVDISIMYKADSLQKRLDKKGY